MPTLVLRHCEELQSKFNCKEEKSLGKIRTRYVWIEDEDSIEKRPFHLKLNEYLPELVCNHNRFPEHGLETRE